MGVLLSSDIKTGQEVFTHYGYDLNAIAPSPMPRDFPWYWDLKIKTEKSDRLEAEKSNKERLKAKRAKREKIKNKQSAKNINKNL